MRTPSLHPDHPILFGEIIEHRWTCDTPFDAPDGSCSAHVTRPEGRRWRVADYLHDPKSKWLRPIIIRPCKASRGGGGWRR